MVDTFGKTDIGSDGQTGGNTSDYVFGWKYTLPENGYVTKITTYFQIGSASGGNYRCLIYDSSNNLKGETTARNWGSSKAFSWEDFVFASPLYLTAGDYWLCLFMDNNSSAYTLIKYDNGDANQAAYDTVAWNGAPNPVSWDGYWARAGSIYATYTTPKPVASSLTIIMQKLGMM